MIELTIDDRPVVVEAGTSIFDAARLSGIAIPVLCHAQNERPVGVCRVCTVDCGDKVLQASCVRPAENGMKVFTANGKVKKHRRMILELLMADHPSPCARQRVSGDCELEAQAAAEGIVSPRFARRVSPRAQDDSSLVISVDHDACILCDRCIRGCDEIRHNNVLGRRGKGYDSGIAFDLNRPMGNSSCVSCGECMVSCPTGALTNKSVIRTVLPGGDPVGVDELKQLPFFQKISGTFLELNKNAVIKRRFRPGEVICREGDYGSTAFYILEGKVEVFLSSMASNNASNMALKKTGSEIAPSLMEMLAGIFSPKKPAAAVKRMQGNIPIDAVVDLSLDNPVAELGEGDIFGEMTCMSLYPRSATVRASTDCVMLEMLRNVLDVIQRNKTLRAEIEKNYRKRALEDHLRSVPLFASLTPDFIGQIAGRVELVRYAKGEVLCRQGEEARGFFLVRIGFVKMVEAQAGGDLVLAYQGKGGYFGEIGLILHGTSEFTVTALDNVEVVRITAEDFEEMMRMFPDIAFNLRRIAEERELHSRRHSAAVSAMSLGSFLNQELMEANSLLVIDLEKCTRCDQCVQACADAHGGVTRLVREGLRFDKYLVPTSCRHCRDPLCMIGCPVGSIRRRNSLETVIEDWCIGCGLCARNCPYGNITMHDLPGTGAQKAVIVGGSATTRKATACDLCADLPEPSCVYACPHDAAKRVDPNDFFRDLINSDVADSASVTPVESARSMR